MNILQAGAFPFSKSMDNVKHFWLKKGSKLKCAQKNLQWNDAAWPKQGCRDGKLQELRFFVTPCISHKSFPQFSKFQIGVPLSKWPSSSNMLSNCCCALLASISIYGNCPRLRFCNTFQIKKINKISHEINN